MSNLSYKIGVDLGSQLNLSAGIRARLLPLVNQAVNGIAQATAARWVEAVQRAKLWSGEKDAYAKTITYKMTGDFTAVVSSDYKFVQDIETGRPPRDLKRMLDTSSKVRRTRDGARFLVIPFRHNTPGSSGGMPAAVHGLAGGMSKSSVTGMGQREVGQTVRLSPRAGMTPTKGTPFLSSPSTKQAAMTASRTYQLGDRLTKSAMKQAGVGAADRKRYAGMVRMETSTPGGAKSSSYLTFRIMSEKSKGWIIPAQPGQNIAEGVAKEMQPIADAFLAEAVKRSLG